MSSTASSNRNGRSSTIYNMAAVWTGHMATTLYTNLNKIKWYVAMLWWGYPEQLQPDETGLPSAYPDETGLPSEFHNHEEFKAYFLPKVDAMRTLLCLYTTNPRGLHDVSGPMFHRPIKGVTDEAIPEHFFKSFTHADFVKKDGKILPNPDTMVSVKSAIEDILAFCEPRLNEQIRFVNCLKKRLKGANDHEKLVTQAALPRVLRATHWILQKRTAVQNFTADGGKTNGEFTEGSTHDLLTAMKEEGVTSNDVLIDCGAAYGFFLWLAAQKLQCKGFGIEIEKERSRIAAEQALGIMKDSYADELLYHTGVGHFSSDLNAITHIPFGTVGYVFDSVFDDDLALHTYGILAKNPNLWMLVTSRARRSLRLANRLSNLGFWFSRSVQCKMTISGEVHTMYIYIREAPSKIPHALYQQHKLTTVDMALRKAMETMIFSDIGTRIRAYEDLLQEINSIQLEIKRRRKIYERSQASNSPASCLRQSNFACFGNCRQCEKQFCYDPHAVNELPSSIHGIGMFAAKDIHPNTFVLPVNGKRVTIFPKTTANIKRTVKLAYRSTGGGFLVAEDQPGRSLTINHVCTNQNCEVICWSDHSGAERFSVLAVKLITKGQELTINYGYSLQDEGFGYCVCPTCNLAGNNTTLIACMKYCDVGNRNIDDLVVKKRWKAMDGRDLYRILKMEEQNPNMTIFTTNNDQRGATARMDRHFLNDFRSREWLQDLEKFLDGLGHNPEGFFQVCIWDDMYTPTGYNSHSMGELLYRSHIPGLARFLSPNGSLLLPCNEDVVLQLARHEGAWKKYYEVEFVSKHDKLDNPLYKATYSLPRKALFGKEAEGSTNNSINLSTAKNIRKVCGDDCNLIRRLSQMSSPEVGQIRYLRLLKRVESSFETKDPSSFSRRGFD